VTDKTHRYKLGQMVEIMPEGAIFNVSAIGLPPSGIFP
jgi:hypothetical protein